MPRPNKYQVMRAKRRKFVDDWKELHGCKDCGETDPRCLDLDHKPGTKKFMSVAVMISTGQAFAKVKEELLKCDVRCANCHRKITHDRRKGP